MERRRRKKLKVLRPSPGEPANKRTGFFYIFGFFGHGSSSSYFYIFLKGVRL
jgi:hypothetical protein